MPSRRRMIRFVVTVQAILFLAHLFLYETWVFSPGGAKTPSAFPVGMMLGILSVSFITASLLAFRYTNTAVRVLYRIAAVWLGLLSFLLLGAAGTWILFGLGRLVGLHPDFHRILQVLFG
ncbi:MAG: hypothetical protein JOZ80_08980, partial [Acidobacteriaceae bacterium]|nr:hypothetical protein [Acidobacteriaceae bacterium]